MAKNCARVRHYLQLDLGVVTPVLRGVYRNTLLAALAAESSGASACTRRKPGAHPIAGPRPRPAAVSMMANSAATSRATRPSRGWRLRSPRTPSASTSTSGPQPLRGQRVHARRPASHGLRPRVHGRALHTLLTAPQSGPEHHGQHVEYQAKYPEQTAAPRRSRAVDGRIPGRHLRALLGAPPGPLPVRVPRAPAHPHRRPRAHLRLTYLTGNLVKIRHGATHEAYHSKNFTGPSCSRRFWSSSRSGFDHIALEHLQLTISGAGL